MCQRDEKCHEVYGEKVDLKCPKIISAEVNQQVAMIRFWLLYIFYLCVQLMVGTGSFALLGFYIADEAFWRRRGCHHSTCLIYERYNKVCKLDIRHKRMWKLIYKRGALRKNILALHFAHLLS